MSKSSRRRAREKARRQVARRQAGPSTAVLPRGRGAPAVARSDARPRAAKRAQVAAQAAEPGTKDAIHAVAWPTGLLNVAAIARHELSALFVSPVGWVVAGVFAFLVSGFGFIGPVIQGGQATMDGVFGAITSFLTLILVPALTMGSIAEERGRGTLEVLLTSPVRYWELVIGKWLGAFVFYALLIATTLVYVVLLAIYLPDKTTVSIAGFNMHVGALDFGLIGATYIGMLLVSAAATAIGVFASSLTRNQIIAYLLAAGILLVLWFAAFLIGLFTAPSISRFFFYISGYDRYQSFSLGQVTLRDTLFFASLAAGALFLSTRWLASRRWR